MKDKVLLVTKEDGKQFKVTVPANAKVTFGPWSPPNSRGLMSERGATGTLRVYGEGKDNILGCFAGVTGFRDLSLQFAEQVAKEEGATIWKSDDKGYVREDKISRQTAWQGDVKLLPAGQRRKRKA